MADGGEVVARLLEQACDLLAAVMSPERLDTVRACLRKPGWDGVSVEEVRVGSDSSLIGVLIQARRITI